MVNKAKTIGSFFIIFISLFFSISSSNAAESIEYTLEIMEHQFVPESITVPANQPFRVTLYNRDRTVEEFESNDMGFEKIVMGGKKITVNIRALKPGTYKFFGEFHPKTANGTIVVK